MSKSLEQMITERDKYLDEVADLDVAIQHMNSLPDEHRLAIELHSMLCHHNHADACSWEYEIPDSIHDWTKYAHAEYLKRATNAMRNLLNKGIDQTAAVDIILDIVRLIK